ncbi:hypothetical protein [Phytohalomonas tamaricis]|uniref:hypothetical protein n=1 Tax=Phytohalomonas tamaricis TaxID=2081032 RepID=UPI00131A12E5|nr:hypothetical protein [Phytohalomonas tamaricis]
MADIDQNECKYCGHEWQADESICPSCGNPHKRENSIFPPFNGHMGFYLNIGISLLFIIAFLIYGIYSILDYTSM